MDLKTTLENLFDTEITDMIEVDNLDTENESPALMACEAARGIFETFDDEPKVISEAVDGFLVSSGRSAILIGHDGSVVAKSLEAEEDDDDDDDWDLEEEDDDDDWDLEEEDADEATTSALVGGFRGGGMAGKPMMGKYGKKMKKKKGMMSYEDVDEDDRDELLEELMEHVRLQTDYGSVSLKVDPYSVLRYPSDDKMDSDQRDAMRAKMDDVLLSSVLTAKPAFESALKKALKSNPHVRQYGIKIKEDMEEGIAVYDLAGELCESTYVRPSLLHEFAQKLIANAGKAGILNKAKDLLPVLDSALSEDDSVRAVDALKQMCEAFGVDEKLIPVPSTGKHPRPPYSDSKSGMPKHGRVAQLKGGFGGQFSVEDIEDMDEEEVFEAGMAFLGGKAHGNPMVGNLDDDPDKMKAMMTALHARRLELVGGVANDSLPAMKMEHEEGTWFIDGLWETKDATEAAKVAHALDIEIADNGVEGDPVYEFKFPRERIKEYVELAAKAGADTEGEIVAVEGGSFIARLPESVATKVRPFFKGEGVEINEVTEPALVG